MFQQRMLHVMANEIIRVDSWWTILDISLSFKNSPIQWCESIQVFDMLTLSLHFNKRQIIDY